MCRTRLWSQSPKQGVVVSFSLLTFVSGLSHISSVTSPAVVELSENRMSASKTSKETYSNTSGLF